MVTFCLEFGTAEEDNVTLHKLSCAHMDHGTLLGLGRLSSLGDFTDSFSALGSARNDHRAAIRCMDCCRTDPIPASRPQKPLYIEMFDNYSGSSWSDKGYGY